MRPAQAKFLLRFLLPQLKSEQIITKKILCPVPPDKGDYKPDAKCMSALHLAWHIAVVEIWFLDAVIHRHFGETVPRPAGVKTGSDVAQWYEENFAQRMPFLEGLSGEIYMESADEPFPPSAECTAEERQRRPPAF